MNRIVGLLCLGLALPALAQSFGVGIEMDPSGGSIRMHVPEGVETEARAEKTERHESSGDGWTLIQETSRDGYTSIEVLEPEGAVASIYEGDFVVAREDVPMQVKVRSEQYFRVVVSLRDGATFEKKIQSRSGMKSSLLVSKFVAPAPRTVVVSAQVRPAPVERVERVRPVSAMSEADFAALARAIEAESFAEQKLDVLRTAARHAHFTMAQVGRLVDLYTFSENKLDAVRAVQSKVVDRQNGHTLYAHFTFSNDKEQLEEILAAN